MISVDDERRMATDEGTDRGSSMLLGVRSVRLFSSVMVLRYFAFLYSVSCGRASHRPL